MDLGPHAFFIVASYAVTVLIIAALILRAWIDHRLQVRALADLEARGGKRRSHEVSTPRAAAGPSALPAPGGR